MTLPSYKRVLFGKAPLRLVVGQVRFPLLFRFNEKPFLAPFQEAIQPSYPRAVQEQQAAVKFSGGGIESKAEALWRFTDREGSWSVVLGEAALTLETRRYMSIDDFIERFGKLLQAAVEHLRIEDRSRLGLRFINEMRSASATSLSDWSALLNPQFVGFGGAPKLLDGTVAHAFSEIQSQRDNGMLVIRHGLLTGTTVQPQPRVDDGNGAQGSFYLLDLDYFDGTETELDIAKTLDQMRAYNESIYQFFRWTLDEGKLYDDLEPRDAT